MRPNASPTLRSLVALNSRRLIGGATCLLAVVAIFQNAQGQEAVAPNQTRETSPVIVTGTELPSAYGAPPAFSRTRFSATDSVYVLPPGAFLLATIYQGDVFRRGKPDNLFTQEVEVGLPHRFGVAMEAQVQDYNGRTQVRNVSIEARYALADWDKIPLNPTLFFEYKFGTGRILHDEAIGEHDEEEGEDMEGPEGPERLKRKLSSHIARAEDDDEGEDEFGVEGPNVPDAVEGRLLFAEQFGEYMEWALNAFYEQEIGGDKGREWGFSQTVAFPLNKSETLKAGVEMQYTNFSDMGIRNDPENRFVIGPSFSWRPNRWASLDFSPLFGVNDQSPKVQIFVVFSMAFGGSHERQAEAPVSTRNR